MTEGLKIFIKEACQKSKLPSFKFSEDFNVVITHNNNELTITKEVFDIYYKMYLDSNMKKEDAMDRCVAYLKKIVSNWIKINS